MEVKVIIYIIAGILYFLYTVGKKQQEKQNQAPQPGANKPAQPQKPVTPPAANPMEEIMREMKRRQAAAEAQKKIDKPVVLPTAKKQELDKGKDLFIHEKKAATFGKGADDSPVYERTADEKDAIHDEERVKHELAYVLDSAGNPPVASGGIDYEFDARNAFIGSVIFERKY